MERALSADTLAKARAFNLGSDARIAGLPLMATPDAGKFAADWRAGWRHVEKFWGRDTQRPVMPLPEVKG